jgi:hypothetical protein
MGYRYAINFDVPIKKNFNTFMDVLFITQFQEMPGTSEIRIYPH